MLPIAQSMWELTFTSKQVSGFLWVRWDVLGWGVPASWSNGKLCHEWITAMEMSKYWLISCWILRVFLQESWPGGAAGAEPGAVGFPPAGGSRTASPQRCGKDRRVFQGSVKYSSWEHAQKSICCLAVAVVDGPFSALNLPQTLICGSYELSICNALCWSGWHLVEGFVSGTEKQK